MVPEPPVFYGSRAFNQARQCGDDVFLMFVTGYPPARGGGDIPQRIIASSRSAPASRAPTGAGWSGNTPGIGGKLPTYLFTTRHSAMIAA
jgi:hypothetical protein